MEQLTNITDYRYKVYKLIEFEPKTTTDWLPVQRGMKIDLDLENSSLEIKTDSKRGSAEKVIVTFFSLEEERAGGITLSFRSPITYRIKKCIDDQVGFPIEIPTETNKVWRITLSRTVELERRVIIHCNEVEVLDIVLTETLCDQNYWRSHWGRDVAKIAFDSADEGARDRASDFYRHTTGQPSLICWTNDPFEIDDM